MPTRYTHTCHACGRSWTTTTAASTCPGCNGHVWHTRRVRTATPPAAAILPALGTAAAPPPLNAAQRANFATLQRAQDAGHLTLVSCRIRATGEPVAVLAAVAFDGQEYQITPLAMQFPESAGNPYEYLADPTDDNGEPQQPAAK